MFRSIGLAVICVLACVSSTLRANSLQQGGYSNNDWSLLRPYHPNYIMPFYYTQSPDENFKGLNPTGTNIERAELKFQISIQVPILHHIFYPNDGFNLGYTQLSYWQAYARSAYFRETNYEPELFYFVPDKMLFHGLHLDRLQVGLYHQSNGRGGEYERSWNRVYIDQSFDFGPVTVSVRPWVRVRFSSWQDYNHDIMEYMGYGRILMVYSLGQNEFSLLLRNEAESGFQRGAEELTFSFPLTKHLRGYMQLWSGYGQSLAEYNHYTNAGGLGISLSDW